MKRRTENVNSRFFGGITLPGKLRCQYLGSYTKFDHFLSKIKEQINMIRFYYIYFNDQTLSLQKEIIWRKNLFVRKRTFFVIKQWVFPLFVHEILLKGNMFLHTGMKFAIFCINSNNTYAKANNKWKRKWLPHLVLFF